MSQPLLLPPITPPAEVVSTLSRQGYAVLDTAGVCHVGNVTLEALNALSPSWHELPADAHLKDGGHYRRRRHSCFVVGETGVTQVPHRAHWQPLEYNALHGGMQRWFEPMAPEVVAQPVWRQLLQAVGGACALLKPQRTPWYVEAHQFRIDTTDGIGRPTPEGAHRDGVDFVAVFLIDRQGIKGGETRVFDAHGPSGIRFTLTEPWSLLLLDDARVIHESTPIQPLGTGGNREGGMEHNIGSYRDTLVLTYRATGFQG